MEKDRSCVYLKMDKWSDDKLKKLIKLYEQRPNLWDREHPDFGKHGPQYMSHKEISEELGVDEKELKAIINKIKIKFKECLQEPRINPIKWRFYDKLRFLTKHIRVDERKRDVKNAAADTMAIPTTAAAAIPSDVVDVTFMAMARVVKEFPRKKIAELQIEIWKLISETQLAQEEAWKCYFYILTLHYILTS